MEELKKFIEENTEIINLIGITDPINEETLLDICEKYKEITERQIAIKFLEWTEKGMWSKFESRTDGFHEMEKWYNTHNYKSMEKALTTVELYDLFISETN